MSQYSPKVSFVTVCFRTPDMIRQLLKGFEATQPSFEHEYFLVNNGSDGTSAMVQERFPWVHVMDKQGNVGFGAGNNLAFREAKGEYVMLVNPDLTLFPGEMEKLLAFADEHPDLGIIGPRLLNPDGSLQRTFHRFPELLIPLYRRTPIGRLPWGKRSIEHYFMQDADPERIQEVDGIFGAAMLIRKAALDAVGGFDERFFMYYEDTDICRRAWEKGWRVAYAPVATFVHYHQRESRVKYIWHLVTNRVVRTHIKSGILYFLKYLGAKHPHPVTAEIK